MRVYLPSTLPAVAAMLRSGEIAAPVHGYAVTPALREWYSSGDIEELEYVAMMHAARQSLRLLAADTGAPRRRVVLAADIADDHVSASAGFEEPAMVEISAPVRMGDIQAGHVDDANAAEEIASAVGAVVAADAGDDDAQFLVDGAEGFELLWYATQELADVADATD